MKGTDMSDTVEAKRMQRAQKMLELLTEAHMRGQVLEVRGIDVEMKKKGLVPSKLATLIWEVRHKLQVPVTAVREGRKVVAYQLGSPAPSR
jgi:hypothetical protein